jgi:hypothetical protein
MSMAMTKRRAATHFSMFFKWIVVVGSQLSPVGHARPAFRMKAKIADVKKLKPIALKPW